jgi:hypothetical protein
VGRAREPGPRGGLRLWPAVQVSCGLSLGALYDTLFARLAMGFVPVGTYRHIGWKHGRWHDVAGFSGRSPRARAHLPSPGEVLTDREPAVVGLGHFTHPNSVRGGRPRRPVAHERYTKRRSEAQRDSS